MRRAPSRAPRAVAASATGCEFRNRREGPGPGSFSRVGAGVSLQIPKTAADCGGSCSRVGAGVSLPVPKTAAGPASRAEAGASLDTTISHGAR